MSTATSVTEAWFFGYRRVAGPRAPALSEAEIATLREMLANLETLTEAGQRHTMAKIVALVGEAVAAISDELCASSRKVAVTVLTRITGESARRRPDPRGFRVDCERLLALLSARPIAERR